VRSGKQLVAKRSTVAPPEHKASTTAEGSGPTNLQLHAQSNPTAAATNHQHNQ
jgi:hypothetical protein